eukprot:2428125-Pleurochrysis_carterae.AAC.1
MYQLSYVAEVQVSRSGSVCGDLKSHNSESSDNVLTGDHHAVCTNNLSSHILDGNSSSRSGICAAALIGRVFSFPCTARIHVILIAHRHRRCVSTPLRSWRRADLARRWVKTLFK